MGIVNVTPDSFYDGGRYFDAAAACARIDELINEGASIIDIGAESTKPRSDPVAPEEQIRRALDAIQHAVNRNVTVSIDTSNPRVADLAAQLGVSVINDASCMRDGDELARVAASNDMDMILMHTRGPMTEMHGFSSGSDSDYSDVVADISKEWNVKAEAALRAGLPPSRLLFDPGLGFYKNAKQSMETVARLAEFASLGHYIVVGPSRKSFLSTSTATKPSKRLGGTIAVCLACAARGVSVLRVHDVLDVKQALSVARDVRLTGSLSVEMNS